MASSRHHHRQTEHHRYSAVLDTDANPCGSGGAAVRFTREEYDAVHGTGFAGVRG